MALILTLIVVAYGIFCAVKFLPSYIASYDLRETVRRQADGATNRTEKQIITNILEKGIAAGLPIKEEHIKVELQKRRNVRIRVEFDVPIDFALFSYTYKFKMDETRSLF